MPTRGGRVSKITKMLHTYLMEVALLKYAWGTVVAGFLSIEIEKSEIVRAAYIQSPQNLWVFYPLPPLV